MYFDIQYKNHTICEYSIPGNLIVPIWMVARCVCITSDKVQLCFANCGIENNATALRDLMVDRSKSYLKSTPHRWTSLKCIKLHAQIETELTQQN